MLSRPFVPRTRVFACASSRVAFLTLFPSKRAKKKIQTRATNSKLAGSCSHALCVLWWHYAHTQHTQNTHITHHILFRIASSFRTHNTPKHTHGTNSLASLHFPMLLFLLSLFLLEGKMCDRKNNPCPQCICTTAPHHHVWHTHTQSELTGNRKRADNRKTLHAHRCNTTHKRVCATQTAHARGINNKHTRMCAVIYILWWCIIKTHIPRPKCRSIHEFPHSHSPRRSGSQQKSL